MSNWLWVLASFPVASYRVTYRVTFGPAWKPKPLTKRRSKKNTRWRSSRSRQPTTGIRAFGDGTEVRSNDLRGFDAGIHMRGSGNSAHHNHIEGPRPNQMPHGGADIAMFGGDGGEYVFITGCQVNGGTLADLHGLKNSLIQFSSATAPGWNDGKGRKK
jgi:hypothetical protein